MIFKADDEFELVGTAANGVEAHKFLQKNEVDFVTLDIHMPELNGVEYLKQHFKPGHPEVLMISSATREDSLYAQEALKSGAYDYVEKPSLANFKESSDEIKNKIKSRKLFMKSGDTGSGDTFATVDFAAQVPKGFKRALIINHDDLNFIDSLIKETCQADASFHIFSNDFEKVQNHLGNTDIHIGNSKEDLELFLQSSDMELTSTMIISSLSYDTDSILTKYKFKNLMIDEETICSSDIKRIVTATFPWESFIHMGNEFLGRKKL
jgi:YesN/AraC family two-component response regulator